MFRLIRDAVIATGLLGLVNSQLGIEEPPEQTFVIGLIIAMMIRLAGRRKVGPAADCDPLDDVLFYWTKYDPFTIRDLLTSIEVKGITGSGKSTASLKHFVEAMVAHAKCTLFIIAQKPEDREFIEAIYRKHGKADKLLVVDKTGKHRCNFIETEMKAGADTRALVELFTTLGEALDAGTQSNQEEHRFFKMLEERILFATIEALKQGNGRVLPHEMQRFLTSAPYSPAQVQDPEWREKSFANQVMRRAFNKQKTTIEAHDYLVAQDFIMSEFAGMDGKPRSSALAGVMNTLQTLNVGLVRELCSTTSTFSPAAIDDGFSILTDFPYAEYGPTGRVVVGGLKYIFQKHILRRKAKAGDFWNVMVMDEYQESATEMDARYLAMCRSHRGALMCLTQTVEGENATIGQHRANQLRSNLGTHIYHQCDYHTAKEASELLGLERQTLCGGSEGEPKGPIDTIFGENSYRGSFSEQWLPILQPNEFMRARNGGPRNNYIVDGIVIRAMPFACGKRYLRIEFNQR